MWSLKGLTENGALYQQDISWNPRKMFNFLLDHTHILFIKAKLGKKMFKFQSSVKMIVPLRCAKH